MKITKQELRQIIKEELQEVMDDREVLIPGFGKLTLNQIEKRLVNMLKDAGQGAMEEPPDFYNLRTGMIQAFYETYRKHKDEERLEELQALSEDGHSDVPSAMRKLGTSMEDAQEILSHLEGLAETDELPSWWMSKVTLAADYLNKCRDYILNPSIDEKIKKVKGGYKATTKSGRELSKDPKSETAAKAQLAAVEISKAERGKK